MKQSRLAGFSLTLLMLLLVLVAAFVFTYQAQTKLQALLGDQRDVIATQAAEGTLTAVSATALMATRDALLNDLATAEAAVDELDFQVNEKLQIIATISTQATVDLATVQNQLNALRDEQRSQAPFLSLQVVEEPQVVGEALTFLAAASDTKGITLLEVVYDNTAQSVVGINQPLYTHIFSQTINAEGMYTITVTAHNANQNTATQIVTGTVLAAVDFQRSTIDGLLQATANQPNLAPETPPILVRRPVFNQWLAAQFGDLSPESVMQHARVLHAFELVTAAEATALPASVSNWQQTDFAALFYVESSDFVPFNEANLNEELADWLYVMDQSTPTDLPPETSSFDTRLGFQAQVLGEAALRQGLYLAGGGETAVALSLLVPNPGVVLTDLPESLRQQLLFPYKQGYQWALSIYQENGASGVTDARQLQASTSQVLTGSSAPPQMVTLPDLTAVVQDGWQLQGEGTWGAFRLQQMLATQPEDALDTAVAGWLGDRYTVYWRAADDALLLVLSTTWDGADSAAAFIAAFDAFAASWAGDDGSNAVGDGRCWLGDNDYFCRFASGADTLIVRAPTPVLAEEIAQQFTLQN